MDTAPLIDRKVKKPFIKKLFGTQSSKKYLTTNRQLEGGDRSHGLNTTSNHLLMPDNGRSSQADDSAMERIDSSDLDKILLDKDPDLLNSLKVPREKFRTIKPEKN